MSYFKNMQEIENYLKISWQLVSQFVSWDFCRYSYEKSEEENTEADVLTFLRNMIVERTEKAATDITKQEIIAKFIMETKTIRTVSRMPCVTTLANTVKRICPELKEAVTELVTHLDTFLEKLDYNENSGKIEILEMRIADAVNDFSKKAYDVLPVPDLFKVVQAYFQSDSQSQKLNMHQPKNLELYINVVNLLRQELNLVDIKSIASVLFDDEEFKNVMYTLKTKGDSLDLSIGSPQIPLQNSLTDSLQLSERFEVQDCVLQNLEENSLSLDNIQPVSSQTLYKAPFFDSKKNSRLEITKDPYRLAEQIDKIGTLTDSEAFLFENPHPTPLFPSNTQKGKSSPRKMNFPERTFNDRRFPEGQFPDPIIINIRSCDEESLREEESDCDFMTQRPAKLKYMHKHPRKKKPRIASDSDSQDTSDCDKDPEFRFLTPTFYKKGCKDTQKVIYISDQESCGSSIITTYVDSQQNDPSFKTRANHFTKPIATAKRKNLKKSPKKKKPKIKSTVKQKTSRQTTLRMFTTVPKPSLDESGVDFKKVVNKKKTFKLFNSDAYPPIPNQTPARKRKPSKEIIQGLGNKRHCKECSMTFRTPSDLKKHIFIFHTNDDFSE